MLYRVFLAGYPLFSEAKYFADQAGVFEIISTSDPQHKQALRQVEIFSRIIFPKCDCLYFR